MGCLTKGLDKEDATASHTRSTGASKAVCQAPAAAQGRPEVNRNALGTGCSVPSVGRCSRRPHHLGNAGERGGRERTQEAAGKGLLLA